MDRVERIGKLPYVSSRRPPEDEYDDSPWNEFHG